MLKLKTIRTDIDIRNILYMETNANNFKLVE